MRKFVTRMNGRNAFNMTWGTSIHTRTSNIAYFVDVLKFIRSIKKNAFLNQQ